MLPAVTDCDAGRERDPAQETRRPQQVEEVGAPVGRRAVVEGLVRDRAHRASAGEPLATICRISGSAGGAPGASSTRKPSCVTRPRAAARCRPTPGASARRAGWRRCPADTSARWRSGSATPRASSDAVASESSRLVSEMLTGLCQRETASRPFGVSASRNTCERLDGVEAVLGQREGARSGRGPGVDQRHLDHVEARRRCASGRSAPRRARAAASGRSARPA